MSSKDVEAGIKISLALIGVGAGLLWTGLKRMRRARAIEDTPCSEIRSAPQGLVEIQGHALPGEATAFRCLEDGFCVYRDLKIEKHVKRGKNSSWEEIFRETEGKDFVLSDGTGIVRVSIEGAELELREKITAWGKFTPEMQERAFQRYSARVPDLTNGTGFLASLTRPAIRFRERVIRIAAPVYAKGHFQTINEMKPYVLEPQHYRFLGRLAELRKQPGWQKKAFDLDRDGKISEFEFDKGSEKLLYLAKNAIQGDDRPEPVAFQGLLRHAPEHGLLIGDSYQEVLSTRLRRFSFLRVVGGAAMVAAGVGVLFSGLFWR